MKKTTAYISSQPNRKAVTPMPQTGTATDSDSASSRTERLRGEDRQGPRSDRIASTSTLGLPSAWFPSRDVTCHSQLRLGSLSTFAQCRVDSDGARRGAACRLLAFIEPHDKPGCLPTPAAGWQSLPLQCIVPENWEISSAHSPPNEARRAHVRQQDPHRAPMWLGVHERLQGRLILPD